METLKETVKINRERIAKMEDTIYSPEGLNSTVNKVVLEFKEFKGSMKFGINILISIGASIAVMLGGIFATLIATIIKLPFN